MLDKRIHLVSEPTPLRKCENISHQLGHDIYLKEDDVTGICMGGNKVRKLEYLFYDAQAKQADTVVTTGGVQSNHARLTTSVARALGFQPELVLRVNLEHDKRSNGNFLLYQLMEANIHYVETRDQQSQKMSEIEQQLNREGKKPYIIPSGGSNPVGVLGYVRAARELKQQLENLGITRVTIFVPVGSGGTIAGLLIANMLWKLDFNVIGVSVSMQKKEIVPKIKELMEETLILMGVDPTEYKLEDPVVYEDYVGPGYALLDHSTAKTIKRLAESDGVILDPVYTGKAMVGLLDLVEKKTASIIQEDSPVVFWHTGGLPGLFAYDDELLHLMRD